MVDVSWVRSKNDDLGNEAVQLWRALKKLTEDYSEARQVVTSVPGEDGYAAWAKLHKRYGMALAMKQGTMLAFFRAWVPASAKRHQRHGRESSRSTEWRR